MNRTSPLSQKQLDGFEKGFLYLEIATQYLTLIYDDLRRDDSILGAEEHQQRSSELMTGIACLMDDAQELITNAACGGNDDE